MVFGNYEFGKDTGVKLVCDRRDETVEMDTLKVNKGWCFGFCSGLERKESSPWVINFNGEGKCIIVNSLGWNREEKR